MGPCFHGFLRVLLTLTRRHSRWFYSGRSVVRGVKAQASCEPRAHANSISKVKKFGWDFVWQRREIAEDESNTRLLPFGLSAFPLTLPLTRLCLCFFPPSLIISIIIFSICWVMQTWREREPAWTAAGIYPNILLGPPRSLQTEPGLSTPEYPPVTHGPFHNRKIARVLTLLESEEGLNHTWKQNTNWRRTKVSGSVTGAITVSCHLWFS